MYFQSCNFGLLPSTVYPLPSFAINREIAMAKIVLITIRVNETNPDGMQRKRGGSVTTGVESTEKK